jgi:hypothetical protein
MHVAFKQVFPMLHMLCFICRIYMLPSDVSIEHVYVAM